MLQQQVLKLALSAPPVMVKVLPLPVWPPVFRMLGTSGKQSSLIVPRSSAVSCL